MTTTEFTASDITPTNTVKDTARLLASLIGEDEIFVHQPQGDQVGAVSVNTWASEITLSHAAASRLLGAIRRSLEADSDAFWRSVPEEDAVEILWALSTAAQVCATVGDKIQSAHMQGLYGKYAQRTGT